jgi:hypothetical protein
MADEINTPTPPQPPKSSTPTVKTLLLGALKSAVGTATGYIIALPQIDPTHFNIVSLGGWKNLAIGIGITVLTSEARFWKQWADSMD